MIVVFLLFLCLSYITKKNKDLNNGLWWRRRGMHDCHSSRGRQGRRGLFAPKSSLQRALDFVLWVRNTKMVAKESKEVRDLKTNKEINDNDGRCKSSKTLGIEAPYLDLKKAGPRSPCNSDVIYLLPDLKALRVWTSQSRPPPSKLAPPP